MVGINFKRPVGPYADTKELEYISALHQSSKEIRQDGSIQARDIRFFLSSRHGIKVEEYVVTTSIIQELGGSLPLPDPLLTDELSDLEGDLEVALKEEESDKDGDEDEEDEHEGPVLDICQLTAMLLIPFFRKGNAKDMLVPDNPKAKDNPRHTEISFDHHQEVVGYVLDVALRNILAEVNKATTTHAENHGVVLTPKVLRQVMEAFGEFDLPNDLLEEMIAQAQLDQNNDNMNKAEVFFNKAAFLNAVTADTQLYNPEHIDCMESTHYDDARKARAYQQLALYGNTKSLNRRSTRNVPAQHKDQDGNVQALPFKAVMTSSNIDNTADTYRSATWFTLVWFETVLVYFAYLWPASGWQTEDVFQDCSNVTVIDEYNQTVYDQYNQTVYEEVCISTCDDQFGCAMAKSLLRWTIILAQLMVLGFIWIYMATMGNTTYKTESIGSKLFLSLQLLLGMLVVWYVTVYSFFGKFDNAVWNTTKDVFRNPAIYTALIGGFIILGYQLLRLVGIFLPLGKLEAGGMEKKEQTIKSAASCKVLNMVEHAMLLHADPSTQLQSMRGSTVTETVLKSITSLHASTRKSAKSTNQKKTMDMSGTSNKALLNFHRMQDTREDTGGIIWFVKKAFNRTIFKQEGVFIHGRLWATNLVQFFVCALLVSIFIIGTDFAKEFAEPKDDGCTISFNVTEDGIVGVDIDNPLPPFDPEWNLTVDGFDNIFNTNETHFGLPIGGFFEQFEGQLPKFKLNGTAALWPDGTVLESPTMCIEVSTLFFSGSYIVNSTDPYVYDNAAAADNQIVEALDIRSYEWRLALYLGLLASFAANLSIACAYIPSFTSTVLKFRSGIMPSLKSDYENFGIYRKSPDETAILFGANFWGCLITAGFTFIVVAGVTFCLVYHRFWPITQSIIAFFLGMAAPILVQTIVMKCLRGSLYSAFYRKKPGAVNIMNAILECWSLAKSAGTVTSRFCKLIAVTCMYIGRLDTPMLAPGVGHIGSSPLDRTPGSFKVDLLSHEAHRHPYIERLGLLYLLKLYNGKDFGTRAGAYWRMLFVLALMPWMRNYRIRPKVLMLEDEDEDISVGYQVQREMEGLGEHSTRGEMDIFSAQLEMDLTRRAYDKIANRNKDLKAALLVARDKVRELRQEKRDLKRQLHRSSSKAGSDVASSMTTDDQEGLDISKES